MSARYHENEKIELSQRAATDAAVVLRAALVAGAVASPDRASVQDAATTLELFAEGSTNIVPEGEGS